MPHEGEGREGRRPRWLRIVLSPPILPAEAHRTDERLVGVAKMPVLGVGGTAATTCRICADGSHTAALNGALPAWAISR